MVEIQFVGEPPESFRYASPWIRVSKDGGGPIKHRSGCIEARVADQRTGIDGKPTLPLRTQDVALMKVAVKE